MFNSEKKTKRQLTSLLLAQSHLEEPSTITYTKYHQHNSQALKHNLGVAISLLCVYRLIYVLACIAQKHSQRNLCDCD